MDGEYDPIRHLSTALSLLPRTLAGVTFSLPVGLSEVDEMNAFVDHMHEVLQKNQNPGTKSLEKCRGPNPKGVKEQDEAGKDCSEGQKQDLKLESLEPMKMEQQPSITSSVDKLSPNTNSRAREKSGKISSEGQCDLNLISAELMLEPRPSTSCDSHNLSPISDKMKIERMDENGKKPRRTGLGLVYDISPFTLIQKYEKTKQVVSVDFTVLDDIQDPDAFTKKAYELEAAVAETERLGGEPKIIGERVFKLVDNDQPRRHRPGLGVQLQQPKFVPLPMCPLPAKVHSECVCQNRAPTQCTNSPETTKVKALSRSQNGVPSTRAAPEMNLRASSSLQRLLPFWENYPEDEERAVAMLFESLNLKPTVIPPLVIPEMPKFSSLDVIRSPWSRLPSIERVRELRVEDPSLAFEEFKRKIFTRSPTEYYSDDGTNPVVEVGSVGSLSTSRGWQISFENEEIDMPSHTGTSGSPNVEIEEFPSQEKVPEMTSDARGCNISYEPEMGSPLETSPVNIEVPLSDVPLDMRLGSQPKEKLVTKEASSRKGKKRSVGDADMNSENMPTASDRNTETRVEASIVEPPRERDEQMAPPKKRKNNEQKTRCSSLIVVEGGLKEVDGVKRSTRIRSRPLRHWMGERFLYGCINNNLPAAVGVKECSPATLGVRVKVKSFVSDEHADLIAWLAK